ncbi:uncharacterized protein LOC18442303 [Amborella trichopoda]|uniref:Uncharacterized protein n=1 Tax=Amborella trichopoda TaxID=13333 RepID=W1Q119_AMBTC|nr:uncharacterized protein LOC18442303 [Amborella trichopoda]XP_011626293.1 uncharacterized protein LOC18442303 [Amborella trichopoda]XP_011626294.1 uncharacterized protein LOC18442303 [Amborella trichopoda]ERN14055.1 hypothetical protein AMTR_s00021p00215510 [Amborella trichopoda]|eukprot:XP_006852588.1 uncharacterized protein LOC18442303 [Amborella trichopoda]
MATAEARAVWQRTANRYFVQEDAKRAPKLACCPSPSCSKTQSETGHGDHGNGPDHSSAIPVPLNWNPTNMNLSPESKWWLQLQPNFGNHKDFTYEQIKALEAELDVIETGHDTPSSKLDDETQETEDGHGGLYKKPHYSLETTFRVSTACLKHDCELRMEELKAVHMKQLLKNEVEAGGYLKSEFGDYWYGDSKVMDMEPSDLLTSERSEKVSADYGAPWMCEKTGPWWHITDKHELETLVEQKTSQHVENCDLPRPHPMQIKKGPFSGFESSEHEEIASTLFEHKFSSSDCYPTELSQFDSASGSLGRTQQGPLHDSMKTFSCENNKKETYEISRLSFESEASKAQLLEALCHSQTRAREAEKAAQKANSEKEHIIKLFFKQASHLFAYKQWLQLLQLETLYLQLKAKEQLLPVLPWKPKEDKQWRQKKKKRKIGHHIYDASTLAFAVAVGLSLAGAGLFLGWTMGWLLPTF